MIREIHMYKFIGISMLWVLASGSSCAAHGFPGMDQGASPGIQEPQTPAIPVGSIRGSVLDIEGKPVAGATVILCDSRSGYPMVGEARRNLVEAWFEDRQTNSVPVARKTDLRGEFEFVDIPQRAWKLVAEKVTPDGGNHSQLPGILNECSEEILLLGTARIVLSSEEGETIEFRQSGRNTLRIDEKQGNSLTLLMVSTAAPRGDVALGPIVWGGPFFQNLIGWNRMPDARTVIHGLPDGEIYFALLSLDNSPGFGAGSVRVESGADVAGRAPFVAYWSDGVHDPPERLKPLFDHVEELSEQHGFRLQQFIAEQTGFSSAEMNDAAAINELIPSLGRELELPDGTRATLADLLAITCYIRLKASEKRNR
jgi:hypothetical protein